MTFAAWRTNTKKKVGGVSRWNDFIFSPVTASPRRPPCSWLVFGLSAQWTESAGVGPERVVLAAGFFPWHFLEANDGSAR
jgi:hypothetical protein